MQNYWHKQAPNQPLYPDLQWSRPENKNQAGKLLIIGGNQHGFAAPARAYGAATEAGIGTARVLLPQAIKKVAGGLLSDLEYATSTPSGSFAQAALGEFLEQSAWADCVLLAGDLGRNSETAIVLESFISTYHGPLCITKDAADYTLAMSRLVLERKKTLMVISMGQLQKLATGIKYEKAFGLGMDLLHLVDGLHDFTVRFQAMFIVKHLDQMVVAVNGQVSSTKLSQDTDIWRVDSAAKASVWWLQNPSKALESLTTAVLLQ